MKTKQDHTKEIIKRKLIFGTDNTKRNQTGRRLVNTAEQVNAKEKKEVKLIYNK
jgi:hypothetical protein